MTDDKTADDFKELATLSPDTPVAPAHGIAALALSMAIRYHDSGVIKDGALYQQYKLEQRNIETLTLDMVFETAIKIEKHLLAGSKRIADIVVDALEAAVEADESKRDV